MSELESPLLSIAVPRQRIGVQHVDQLVRVVKLLASFSSQQLVSAAICKNDAACIVTALTCMQVLR